MSKIQFLLMFAAASFQVFMGSGAFARELVVRGQFQVFRDGFYDQSLGRSVQCLSIGDEVASIRSDINNSGQFAVSLPWEPGSAIACLIVDQTEVKGVLRAKLADGKKTQEWVPSALAGEVDIGKLTQSREASGYIDGVESIIEIPNSDYVKTLARKSSLINGASIPSNSF
jgi:hypothetical protein